MNKKRTEKSIKNIVTAMIVQVITLLLSFVTRTLLVKSLGVESVSLNGLFTEVIAMLSLTELGVGSAIIYNLYKPLAQGDEEKICQLMRLFKIAYRVIALATFAIGCSLIPIINLLVKDISYSDNYVRIVYFLFVVQTSTSYLFSYKVSLLNADQRKFIHSIINVAVKCVCTGVSAIVLFTTYNFILYLLVVIIFSFITNVIASIVVDRLYPYLKKDYGKLSKKEGKKVFTNIKYLFVKNVSAKITNSTDNILISSIVGVLTVGIYTNYSMIFNAVKQFSVQISGALAGSLGNLFAVEKSEHCSNVLSRLTYIFFLMSSSLSICLYCCISPFISVWLGDDWLLENPTVFICSVNMFIDFAKIPLWQSLEVSGLFKKDKNISIIGSVANLIVSIVFGIRWGILGIFIGTFVTYVIQITLKIKLLYKDFFKISSKYYYLKWLVYLTLTVFEMFLSKFICDQIVLFDGFFKFLLCAIVGLIVPLLINIPLFIRTKEFNYLKSLCSKFLRKKSNRV